MFICLFLICMLSYYSNLFQLPLSFMLHHIAIAKVENAIYFTSPHFLSNDILDLKKKKNGCLTANRE